MTPDLRVSRSIEGVASPDYIRRTYVHVPGRVSTSRRSYVMTYLGCGLDRVERSERPKFGVLDLPMHADLVSSDGIHVVARSS